MPRLWRGGYIARHERIDQGKESKMTDYTKKEARRYAGDFRAWLESVPAYRGHVADMLARRSANHATRGHTELARAFSLESRRAARQSEFA